MTKRLSTKYRDRPEPLAPRRSLFARPDVSRRGFFQLATAGVTGSFLASPHLLAQAAVTPVIKTSGMKTRGTAKNTIVIHLVGAMSHVDTFDLKFQSGTTPASFAPTTIKTSTGKDVSWPMGLLPKIGSHLNDVGIVRSMQSHALVHSLAQTWLQIGRNPAAALGDIAPNIGSIIALEKEKERKPGQVLPSFIGLNAGAATGAGYLAATYAPFQVSNPRVGNTGVADTTNLNGETIFNSMYTRLQQYDGAMRASAPYGSALSDMGAFYTQAKGMVYSPVINNAFGVITADSNRYGTGAASTTLGNACLVAKQILAQDQGTRFIQIDFGSWDHHQDIYGLQNAAGNNIVTMGTQLDNALGALIDDLKAAGLFDQTLIVVVGEFGRTPGVSAAGGRDHYKIQSALLAGGGIKGGTVIGATNAVGTTDPGGTITDFGWAGVSSGPRQVWIEDLEATIYDAMGVDWTTVRYDDPFQRGFEYVPPDTTVGKYSTVNELFK